MGKNCSALAIVLTVVVAVASIPASARAQSIEAPLGSNPPTITNLDGDFVTLPTGQSAVALDANANATLSDPDSADFSGGNVTVSIVSGFQLAEDALGIGSIGNISVAGNNVKHGITTIGAWLFEPETSTLTIFLNAGATLASVQDLLRALQFQNAQVIPNGVLRTVRVTVADGDGGVSEDQDITVSFETECVFSSGFEAEATSCE